MIEVAEFKFKKLEGVPFTVRIPIHAADIPEAKLQEIVLAHVNRLPGVEVWRMNTGAAKISGAWVTFGREGQADLGGLMKLPGIVDRNGKSIGQRVEIELKAKRGRLRDKQREYGDMIERFGGLYVIARTLSQAMIPICEAMGYAWEEYDPRVGVCP